MRGFLLALAHPQYAKGAVKVALIVGTILFTINHGAALVHGEMTAARWLSGLLTYAVPYFVNIHGRYVSCGR